MKKDDFHPYPRWKLAADNSRGAMCGICGKNAQECQGQCIREPYVERKNNLPTNAAKRKEIPLATGCLDYFPDALAAVAGVSYKGNQQHNPGEPAYWARGKSMDQADCIMRHFVERGTIDVDGQRHSAKLAWRALALLQIELEQDLGLKISRGSKLPDGNPGDINKK